MASPLSKPKSRSAPPRASGLPKLAAKHMPSPGNEGWFGIFGRATGSALSDAFGRQRQLDSLRQPLPPLATGQAPALTPTPQPDNTLDALSRAAASATARGEPYSLPPVPQMPQQAQASQYPPAFFGQGPALQAPSNPTPQSPLQRAMMQGLGHKNAMMAEIAAEQQAEQRAVREAAAPLQGTLARMQQGRPAGWAAPQDADPRLQQAQQGQQAAIDRIMAARSQMAAPPTADEALTTETLPRRSSTEFTRDPQFMATGIMPPEQPMGTAIGGQQFATNDPAEAAGLRSAQLLGGGGYSRVNTDVGPTTMRANEAAEFLGASAGATPAASGMANFLGSMGPRRPRSTYETMRDTASQTDASGDPTEAAISARTAMGAMDERAAAEQRATLPLGQRGDIKAMRAVMGNRRNRLGRLVRPTLSPTNVAIEKAVSSGTDLTAPQQAAHEANIYGGPAAAMMRGQVGAAEASRPVPPTEEQMRIEALNNLYGNPGLTPELMAQGQAGIGGAGGNDALMWKPYVDEARELYPNNEAGFRAHLKAIGVPGPVIESWAEAVFSKKPSWFSVPAWRHEGTPAPSGYGAAAKAISAY